MISAYTSQNGICLIMIQNSPLKNILPCNTITKICAIHAKPNHLTSHFTADQRGVERVQHGTMHHHGYAALDNPYIKILRVDVFMRKGSGWLVYITAFQPLYFGLFYRKFQFLRHSILME